MFRMSNHKKYQIFISSTYLDLKEAREKVTKVILDLYHLPVGMEMFSADDDEQWKIITDAIDVSDYYILILGHRYGSLTNKGISYTEKEFNYAKSKGIPILTFVRERDVPTIASEREDNPESIKKLAKFIDKATKNRMGNFWRDISDLERHIAVALPKSFARHGGIGWIRGDQTNQNVLEEMARLSEENRNLRDEISVLKDKVELKAPELKVFINKKDISENDFSFILNLSELDQEELYKLPDAYGLLEDINLPASILRDMHVMNRIGALGGKSIEDCKREFNTDLKKINSSHIEIHNDGIKKIKDLENNYENFEVEISNAGNSMASTISIHIEFPQGLVTVLDHGMSYEFGLNARSIKDLEYYQEKIYSHMIKLPNIESRERAFIPTPFGSGKAELYLPRDIFNFEFENKIEFDKDNLLHQRDHYFEKYSIIPLKKGNGKVLINVMCKEYDEAKVFEFLIVVN